MSLFKLAKKNKEKKTPLKFTYDSRKQANSCFDIAKTRERENTKLFL